MDTSRMLKLTDLNTNQLFSLYTQSEKLMEIATDLKSTMELALARIRL